METPDPHPQPDIDELTRRLLDRLKRDDCLPQFSAQLMAKTTYGARAKHCYQRIRHYGLLPAGPNTSKCDQLSAEYRTRGNDLYAKKMDRHALAAYDSAIRYAVTNKLLSLAYANRSAVLCSRRQYSQTLLDIERALKAGYDDELKPKLIRRRALCEEALLKNPKKHDEEDEEARRKILSFSTKTLKDIPCASSSLKLSHSPEMGRCVVAAEDISPGQVLVVEEPYMTLLLPEFYGRRCLECCAENCAMIPCEFCHYVMFCDESCREAAWKSHHRFECPLMSRLIGMKFTKIELLSLRALIQARCERSSWDELFDIVDKAESETDPLLKGFIRVENPDGTFETKYDSKHYVPIHMLETNVDKRDSSDFYNRSVTSAVFLHMLKEYTSFFDNCPNNRESVLSLDPKEYIWRAAGLMVRHNMTSASNMHSIEALTETVDHRFLGDCNFASGAYAFLSLLNHSCCPNVGRVSDGTSKVLLALRPIKKGQQIFDNYGRSHHAMSSYMDRQINLRFQYKFKCECEACVNQWPEYGFLQPANITNKKIKKKFRNILDTLLIEQLQKGNKSVACNIINELYRHVAMLEEYSPCKEIADYQETIKQCWALFGNVIYNR